MGDRRATWLEARLSQIEMRKLQMAYQVIARKYRPQRFSEVVGQEHVTQTLVRAIEQKRIAHAYLFCGPRGTGKTTREDPPEHVKFMFATTEPKKVLLTILSRCQRFDLRRIPAALIVKHLAHVAKQEKVNIDPAALYAIARGAGGAMRDAESTLDQLISFCGNKIEEPDVLSMFGLTAQSQLLELSRAVLAGAVEAALRQLNGLASHGKDMGRLLGDLLKHF